jgi:hypothetical protein
MAAMRPRPVEGWAGRVAGSPSILPPRPSSSPPLWMIPESTRSRLRFRRCRRHDLEPTSSGAAGRAQGHRPRYFELTCFRERIRECREETGFSCSPNGATVCSQGREPLGIPREEQPALQPQGGDRGRTTAAPSEPETGARSTLVQGLAPLAIDGRPAGAKGQDARSRRYSL